MIALQVNLISNHKKWQPLPIHPEIDWEIIVRMHKGNLMGSYNLGCNVGWEIKGGRIHERIGFGIWFIRMVMSR